MPSFLILQTGLEQTRSTDVVVAIVFVLEGALGSLQEAVVVIGLGLVLHDTVIVLTVVTRYVVYRIHKLRHSQGQR